MALLWMDSFDHYATADISAKYQNVTGAPTIVSAGGRRGGGCLQITSSTIILYTRTLPVSGNTLVVGHAVKISAFSASQLATGGPRLAGAAQLTLEISSTGYMQVIRGSSTGTVLGTATTGQLTLNTYYYIELKAVIHPTAGSAIVRVNGVDVLNLTGVNTAGTGSAGWDAYALHCGNAGTVTLQLDDLYVFDGSGSAPLNDFLGDVRVDARVATAAGATTTWTPSTGSNWQNVDDATPNGDTDYNATFSVPATDTFPVQDAPVPGATLYGVQVSISAKKSDAGAGSLAPVIRHSGTDYAGSDLALGTGYLYVLRVYATNPGTGAAWTEADFNAAEFGYKRTL
jgi:hypothetical protein